MTAFLAAALIGTFTYSAMHPDVADTRDDIDDDEVPYGGYRQEDERHGVRRSFAKNCTLFDTTARMYRQVELNAVRLRGQPSLAPSAV